MALAERRDCKDYISIFVCDDWHLLRVSFFFFPLINFSIYLYDLMLKKEKNKGKKKKKKDTSCSSSLNKSFGCLEKGFCEVISYLLSLSTGKIREKFTWKS